MHRYHKTYLTSESCRLRGATLLPPNDGGLGFLCIPLRPRSTGPVLRFARRVKDEIVASGNGMVDYIVPDSDADADIDVFFRGPARPTTTRRPAGWRRRRTMSP
ncbi:hypothetical protein FOMPIDRAFT_1053004 [Fomitopsis schrenkii]|uniref:Uncharacterized protein n=1 Tax=Fomitopsis schrenkii TaxID=2126942 RepID=S8E098_FOMSC|nr:hypothetical protein FOMPIDRAFT_1053004 [Fomitopsis schrenkii]